MLIIKNLETINLNIEVTNVIVDFKQQKFNADVIAKLCDVLKNCINMKQLSLNLYQNQIEDKCLTSLGPLFEQCTKIKSLFLDLSCNSISEKAQQDLHLYLTKLTNLKEINLNLDYNNIINLQPASSLINVLAKNPNLENLSLSVCGNDHYYHNLYEEIAKTEDTNIKILSLRFNNICFTPSFTSQIDSAFQNYKNLVDLTLNLGNEKNEFSAQINQIGSYGALTLARSLQNLINLQTLILNLKLNQINDGVKHLGDALKKLVNLKKLQLQLEDNQIENGVANLWHGLQELTNLQYLFIDLRYRSSVFWVTKMLEFIISKVTFGRLIKFDFSWDEQSEYDY
ncbi:hypothetical protein ABPG74_013071 [Tetrahymena malaccensis]